MDIQQAFLGQIGFITAIAIVVCGVYKIFQIGAELSQIKDILSDIRRNTQDYTPSTIPGHSAPAVAPPFPGRLTDAEIERALHDDSYLAEPPPVAQPHVGE